VTSTFQHRQASIATQIIGWVVFIIATAGLVGSFKQALNTVWNAEPPKHPVLTVLMNQAIAFAIVLVLATLAVLSLFVNAALAAATGALATVSPLAPLIVHAISFFLSFIVIAGVFGLLFEVLPDTRVQWRDVWIGAVVTAFLFVAGQAVLGWYLGVAGIGSTFGIFGSLVIFLLWTNYSAQTVLVGAEFTHVYACTHGSHRAR
ncbi:MAG: YihY/virulence factor BrkB family protein, partial [Candidatus Eremiobacteraeota bacterium]|nr:YihY/virulence factor BrkB family protein [Candidatus Eremiobacteraeota bacterium]